MDNHLLAAGDRVVVGVSGGADSVCLLFLLCAFQERIPLSLRVVHVHHGIREEAGKDAAYVKSLCESLNIPFRQVNADVPALARQKGMTEEEAGRMVRYEAFHDCAVQMVSPDQSGDTAKNPVKIALAHHMGDRAETLLFHLFRGSGIKGLGSIQPTRETREGELVIRPLLCLNRDEIESYLAEKGVSFCQDRTNDEDEHARNRIRHHILPYAEEEICHGAVRHVNEAAELLSEAEDYLQWQTEKALETCCRVDFEGKGVCSIDVREFQEQHPLIQKRIILELLSEFSDCHKDIGAIHVEAVRDLFQGESGRQKNLPFGILARREYGRVILEKRAPQAGKTAECDAAVREELPVGPLLPGEEILIQWGEWRFHFRLIPFEKKEIIPEKIYTKWFDYDKIKDTLFIRNRKSGDSIALRGQNGGVINKSVKDYMITEKIPRENRDEIPLLVEGGQVLWITGHRISEFYKVSDDTKTVLQVEAWRCQT